MTKHLEMQNKTKTKENNKTTATKQTHTIQTKLESN